MKISYVTKRHLFAHFRLFRAIFPTILVHKLPILTAYCHILHRLIRQIRQIRGQISKLWHLKLIIDASRNANNHK